MSVNYRDQYQEQDPLSNAEKNLLDALERPLSYSVEQALASHRQRLLLELEHGGEEAVLPIRQHSAFGFPGYAIAASILVGLFSLAMLMSPVSRQEETVVADSEVRNPNEDAALILAGLSEEEWQMVQDLEFIWWLQEQQELDVGSDKAG